MPRPGRDLETLIEALESFLAGAAEIRSPDHIPDRTTGQMREVDVSVRATVGSAAVLIILECRDRSRPEDVTWIEQPAQKRDSVGADKAIAVSSAGFTDPALRKAAALGVDIRRVDQIDLSEIASWFQIRAITLQVTRAELLKASLEWPR